MKRNFQELSATIIKYKGEIKVKQLIRISSVDQYVKFKDKYTRIITKNATRRGAGTDTAKNSAAHGMTS